MKSFYIFLASLILIVLVAYFALISPRAESEDKKVATSIFAIYSLTSQIADGGDIEVINILPDGASPHQYQPTAQDQLRLSSINKVFVIGHELDGWAENVAVAANSDVQVITMDRGIDLMQFGDEHHHDDHDDDHIDDDHTEDEHHHEHGDNDPHYWLSIANAKIIAETIKNELIDLDNDNESVYTHNYNNLVRSLDELLQDAKQASGEFIKKEIITFHSAFNYLAKELDVDVVATIEEFPGQTPAPSYIAAIGRTIREHNVTVLFKEPELSDEIVGVLAQDYGATVETLNPLESGIAGATYQVLMRENIESIARSLGQN